MSLSQSQRFGILALLALILVVTRLNHFALVPDASWAVFFIAGFYLRGSARWAFPLLMALAVLADFIVISGQGIAFWSHYCMSPGYWCLLAAYGALWFGGSWLRSRHAGVGLRSLGMLTLTLLAATSVCFVISNGSFYWLGTSVAEPTMNGWLVNMGHWYLTFLGTTAAYVGIAAALHVLVTRLFAGIGVHARKPGGRG